MLDWKFNDDNDTLPDLPDGGRRSRRSWALVAVVIVLLAAAGGIGLRRWLVRQEQAMRQDLEAFIEQEERARRFGRADRAAELIAPSASAQWWQAYRRTFTSSGAAGPVEVTIGEVEFDENGALTTVAIVGNAHGSTHRYTQLRYYRLVGQEWRRAPLPDGLWTGERQVLTLDNGIQVLFRARDRTTAEALARDLPVLFDRLDRWPDGAPKPEQIEFLANELHPPLISSGTVRIELNSPLLVPFDGTLGGVPATRFALAQSLVWQNTSGADDLRPLPGAARFLRAAKTTTAMHWALPTVDRHRLRDRWRSQMDGRWESPFFAPFADSQETLDQGTRADLAALLTADYVYSLGGSEALTDVMHGMTRHDSWDAVFQEAIGRDTLTLEREAARYAHVERGVASNDRTTTGELPLTASFLERTAKGQLAALAADSRAPVLIDLTEKLRMRTPDGSPIVPGCFGSGTGLHVDGEWREIGRRLAAQSMIVFEPHLPESLSPVTKAPSDTVAYVVDSEPESPLTLHALRPSGALEPLLEVGDARNVRALASAVARTTVDVTFAYYPENCNRSWFVRFEPRTARLDGLLLSPAAPIDPDFRDAVELPALDQFLLIGRMPDGTWRYRLLDPKRPFAPHPRLSMNLRVTPIGWSYATDRLVVLDPTEPQRFGLTPLFSDEIRWFGERTAVRLTQLSPSGRWFLYTRRAPSESGAVETVHVVDLVDRTERTVLELSDEQTVVATTWSARSPNERVLVLVGRRTPRRIGGRILLIDPQQPDEVRTVAESTGDIWFRSPILCPDGRTYYLETSADSTDTNEVLMMLPAPGAEAIRLGEGKHLRLLTCGTAGMQ